MSLLDRLNLLVRSELSDLRRRDSSRGFSDMQASLRDARRQQIELRRSEKKLIEQIRGARDKADQWEERAILALKNGDEDLAREALIVKNKALDEAERLRDELEEQRAYLKDISSALEALEMKLQGTKSRIESERESRSMGNLREASSWDAEMERRLEGRGRSTGRSAERPTSSSTSGSPHSSSARDQARAEADSDLGDNFGTSRSFQEFDRMSSKINAMEADIDAMRELAGDDWIDPRRRELEDIFSKMETKKRTDDDLSDLKKKFE
jgi:phage shock protein A